jgi:hypothetical protein
MNSKRQSCCQRPTMSELRFIFKTLSLLRTTIMLFIRCTILKRLFKLCSLLIESYNINIGHITISAMLTSFTTYFRMRSMMNLLLRIITNIVLGLLLSLRSITMRRKLVLLSIPIQGRMIGPLGAAAICVRTRSSQR